MFDFSYPKNFMATNLEIAKYTWRGSLNRLKNKKDPNQMRRNALDITARGAIRVLDNMNVKVNFEKSSNVLLDRNYFMICNHMSYLDIIILSSLRPAVFVTSVEVEKTFFLGDMSKLGGSFFVNRINRRKMKEEVQALMKLLDDGFNVFIFPEGTSTNGSGVIPFKKSLFRVPFQTQFPILPICLKYEAVNGEPFSEANRDKVCWYDDMTFAPHFLQLMGIKEMEVSVKYLDPLDPKDFSDHGELSEKAYELISAAYQE